MLTRTLTLFVVIPLSTINAQEPGTPEALVEWAQQHAHPLTSLSVNEGDDDLAFLRELVGDARVVGIGESYHNAQEMLQVRYRVARYLVERLGFDAIMFESGMAQSKPVYDYVLGKEATPDLWTKGLSAGFGRPEPVQELIEWARAHNEVSTDKLRVLGTDISAPLRINGLFEFMDRVNPKAAQYFRGELEPILKDLKDSGGLALLTSLQQLTDDQRNALRLRLEEIVDWMNSARVDAVNRTSLEEYQWAALAAANVRHTVLTFILRGEHLLDTDGVLYATRDRHMAETIVRMLDQLGPDGRIVYLAHNVHVQMTAPGEGASSGRYYTAGTFLRSLLGDAYRAIGQAFGTGRVYDLRDGFALGDVSAWDRMSVKDADPGSSVYVNRLLSRVGIPRFALDFGQAPRSGPVHQWLHTEQQWAEGLPDGRTANVPGVAFSGVIYIDHITPAKLAN